MRPHTQQRTAPPRCPVVGCGRIRPTFSVPEELRTTFDDLAAELVDWRLAASVFRQYRGGRVPIKVIQASGRPILIFDRARHRTIPNGEVWVEADGEPWVLRFVTISVNVGWPAAGGEPVNQLPSLLQRWFGSDAGLPGTHHIVELHAVDGSWRLQPAATEADEATDWLPSG